MSLPSAPVSPANSSPPSSTSDLLTPAWRAEISAHLPIHFTSSSQPFLPIPHPSPALAGRLALTLPSFAEAETEAKVATLSNPLVYSQLARSPVPYLAADAVARAELTIGRWERCLARWASGDFSPDVLGESGCPLDTIRIAAEGQEQGEGEYVGNIGLSRWGYSGEMREGEEKDRMRQDNEGREVGDKHLVWTFGFFLSPSFHRLAILSSTLRALLLSWVVNPSVLDGRSVRGVAYVGNWGSRRAMEKCGLRILHMPRDLIETGGKMSEAKVEKEAAEEQVQEQEQKEMTYLRPAVPEKGGGVVECWVLGWDLGNNGPLLGGANS